MVIEPLDNAIVLMGTGEPQITFFKGGQWGPEHTQTVFQGSLWTIFPDGTFLFRPPVTADVRNDLYPIKGSYALIGDALEIQGKQQSELGASSSLDGTMKLQGDTFLLDVIFTVSSASQRIAHITQTLSFASLTAEPLVPQIPPERDGMDLPSAYAITLTGNVDGHRFGPINGHLKLFVADTPDTNPFRVELTTEIIRSIGNVFWTSFLHYKHGQGLLCAHVTLQEGGQISLETVGAINPVSPSWFTILPVASVGDLMQGVTGKEGRLTFAWSGAHLSGEIYLTGTSDLGQTSVYKAQFIGERRWI